MPRLAPRVMEAPLHGSGHPLGHHYQEVDVVWGKCSLGEAADVENAEQVLTGDEGHAEQGLDAPHPQDRVGDSGLVYPVEDDRPPLGGDPTGEPGTHGDSDTLANLFFETSGGTGHQLAANSRPSNSTALVSQEKMPNTRSKSTTNRSSTSRRWRAESVTASMSRKRSTADGGSSPAGISDEDTGPAWRLQEPPVRRLECRIAVTGEISSRS